MSDEYGSWRTMVADAKIRQLQRRLDKQGKALEGLVAWGVLQAALFVVWVGLKVIGAF